MLREKVDKQIYLRGREKLGDVNDNVTTNDYGFKNKRPSGNVFTIPLKWTKNYYIFKRNAHEIPGYFPGDEIKYSIDDFLDYYNNINTQSIIQVDAGFTDTLSNYENVAYTCILKTKRGVNSTINISMDGWGQNSFSISAFYDSEWHNLTFNYNNNDINKSINITLPDNKTITLAICFYYFAYEENATCKIIVDAYFSNVVDSWAEGFFNALEPPRWFGSGVYTSADYETMNVKNTLIWRTPENKVNWQGNGVYKSEVVTVGHSFIKDYGNNIGNNSIMLSSAALTDKYSGGRVITNNNIDYEILTSREIDGNRITNGGFVDTANWEFSHTGVENRSTAHFSTYKPYFGDGCVKFTLEETDTAKTIYMTTATSIPIAWRSNSVGVVSTPYPLDFSFAAKVATSGGLMPYWKMYYYSSNDGTQCSSASSVVFISTSSSWKYETISFGSGEYGYTGSTRYNTEPIPTNCSYMKPYLYVSNVDTALASASNTAAAIMYVDAVKISRGDYNTYFSDTSEPLTMLDFNINLSLPKNNRTLDIYTFDATSNPGNIIFTGKFGHTAQASSNPYIKATAFSGGLFTGGVELSRSHYNYIKNGDGDAPIMGYNLHTAFYESTSLATPMFGNKCMRIFSDNISTSQGIFTYNVFTSKDLGGDTAWGFSVWLKSNEVERVRLGIGSGGYSYPDSYTQYSTVYGITSKWKRYYFVQSWPLVSTAEIVSLAYVSIPAGSVGTIYADGFQLEKDSSGSQNPPVTPFVNDAIGGIGSSNNANSVLKIHSCNSLFSGNGSMSFVWTPQADSAGYNNKRLVFWERYKSNGGYDRIQWATSAFMFTTHVNGIDYHAQHTCRAFHTNNPVFFGLRWDEGYFYFDVGTSESQSVNRYNVATADTAYLGCDNARSNYADGVYSNLRMDTCLWDDQSMQQQKIGVQIHPDSYLEPTDIYYTEYVHIADVHKNQCLPIFGIWVDENNIVNNNIYYYKLDAYDQYGNRSLFSSQKYILAGDNIPPGPVTDVSNMLKMKFVNIFRWTDPSDKDIKNIIVTNQKPTATWATDNIVQRIIPAEPNMRHEANFPSSQHSGATVVIDNYYYLMTQDVWGNVNIASATNVYSQSKIKKIINNYIINGSLIYTDADGTPVGWNGVYSSFTVDDAGDTCIPYADRCVDMRYGVHSYTYNNFSFKVPEHDENTQFTLSAWIHKYDDTFQRIVLRGFNNKDETLSVLGGYSSYTHMFPNSGYATSTYDEFGNSSDWYLYHTTFAATSIGATADVLAYIDVIIFGQSTALSGAARYSDRWQFIKSSTPDPTYYDTEPIATQNININSIKGADIVDESLTFKIFPSSKLLVNNNTYDADDFVVGEENSDNAFVKFSPNNTMYHPSGMATTAGFQYARHVESGVAQFDTTIPFAFRFVDWNGVGFTPHLLIAPNNYKTYDADNSANDQSFRLVYNATASGVYVNGYLLNLGGDGQSNDFYDMVNKEWNVVNSDPHRRDDLFYGYSNHSGEAVSTVLPHTSRGWGGKIKLGYIAPDAGWGTVDLPIKIFATSIVSTAYDSATWNLVKEEILSCQSTGQYTYVEWWNENFNNARSLAIDIGVLTDTASITANHMYYSTSAWTVIDSGSGIGEFNWIAMDGGWCG